MHYQRGSGGGAVIVTSRREDVIRRMVVGSDDKHVIRLQPQLSDEICWQIFTQVLQQQGKLVITRTKLSSIEDDFKRNFDGLPLAANTFANILTDMLTYWLRARDLYILFGDKASCWRWTFLPPPQEMEEVAELVADVPYIFIQGSVDLKELVMKTSCSAYLVYKLKTKDHPGLNREATAQVRIVNERNRQVECEETRRVFMESEGVQRKGEEEQGWMEINLGHHIFTSNDLGGDHGRFFQATFIDDEPRYFKSGLVVKGIEFRAYYY